MEPLEVNGDAPQLAGLLCNAIRCVEYWHAGQPVELANVVYLSFGGAWYRLYFDCGLIFWRPVECSPESYEAPELDSSYPVADVAAERGLLGLRLSHYAMVPIEGGSRVSFVFEGGKCLTFNNVDDVTSYYDASQGTVLPSEG